MIGLTVDRHRERLADPLVLEVVVVQRDADVGEGVAGALVEAVTKSALGFLDLRRRDRVHDVQVARRERGVPGFDVGEDLEGQLVGLAVVGTRQGVVAHEGDLDVVLPGALDLVRAVADRRLVAGVEVGEAGLGHREEAGVADDGREARERARELDGEGQVVDLLQTGELLAFGAGASSGPSSSGSSPAAMSSMPSMRLMKYALFWAFGP